MVLGSAHRDSVSTFTVTASMDLASTSFDEFYVLRGLLVWSKVYIWAICYFSEVVYICDLAVIYRSSWEQFVNVQTEVWSSLDCVVEVLSNMLFPTNGSLLDPWTSSYLIWHHPFHVLLLCSLEEDLTHSLNIIGDHSRRTGQKTRESWLLQVEGTRYAQEPHGDCCQVGVARHLDHPCVRISVVQRK